MKKERFGLAAAAACLLAVPALAKDELHIFNACYLHAEVACAGQLDGLGGVATRLGEGYLAPGSILTVTRGENNHTVHTFGKPALIWWRLSEKKTTGKGKNKKVTYTPVSTYSGNVKYTIAGETYDMVLVKPATWGIDNDSVIMIVCPPEPASGKAAK